MTVIATDFVPTQPYETDVVTLGVGQRTDVLVTAKQDPQTALWMRTQLLGGPMCDGLGPYGAPIPPLGAPMPPGTVYPDVMAAIYYEDADPSIEPSYTTILEPISCSNDDLALSRPASTVAPTADPYTLNLIMTLALNSTGHGGQLHRLARAGRQPGQPDASGRADRARRRLRGVGGEFGESGGGGGVGGWAAGEDM